MTIDFVNGISRKKKKDMGSQPTKAKGNIVSTQLTQSKGKAKDKDNEEEYDETNLENLIIIWYDENPIDPRLQSLNTVVRSFTDGDKCLGYIKSIKNEFIFLIIGQVLLARPFLDLKREYKQIESIYVLCLRQPEQRDPWKDTKLFTDLSSLIDCLENDINFSKKQSVRIRPLNREKDLDFVWHFLFLQLLFQMDSPRNSQKELFFNQLKDFYQNDQNEVKLISAFQRNYRPNKALWWLTRQHKFLTDTLNKALRVKDYEFLCHYRFYLKDLFFQMNQFQLNDPLIVYRTQKVNLKSISKLPIGTLVLIETFFFTTIDYPEKTSDTIFEIHIQEQTSHPFAQINEHGDILFYPMSVFRLERLTNESVVLTLDQRLDVQVEQLIQNSIEKYSLEPTNPVKMGLTLWKLKIGTIKQVFSFL